METGKNLDKLNAGKGLQPNTALHGWSMTKTVSAMLACKKFQEVGLDIETPGVDAFPDATAPDWVAQWREDERAQITVADLLYMRAGLKINEGYTPGTDVVKSWLRTIWARGALAWGGRG